MKNLQVIQADLADYLTGDLWFQGYAAENPAAPKSHRLLLPGVRDHRGAAAVLRRPGDPGRRPPQGGQRPRRADHRRRPALPAGLLPPVAERRRLAAGALPAARPELAAADPAARRRRARYGSRCRWPAGPCSPRSGWPRSAGCRCCCSTPTSSRTAATSGRSTDRLYGGGTDHRLAQEVLLGIGGVRAIRAYCAITGTPAPEVFHTNEGHAGFLGPGADPRVHGRRAWTSTPRWSRAARAPCSPPTPRCRPASTGSRAS